MAAGYRHAAPIPGVTHAVTTRHGPAFGRVGTDEATAQAAAECAAHLRMDGTAWAHQMHGDVVLRATRHGLAGQADALWTTTPGLLLAGRSADCPIILVAGRRTDDTPVVGFAHASWRSTVQGITRNLLQAMDARPASLRAIIAPSAGPCCYEVGPEVREAALAALGPQAAAFFRSGHSDQENFDLWAANEAQLRAGGVAAERIQNMRVCTICQGRDFWSWRRQKEAAGRFAGLIGLG
ncbi:hypothetical protein CSB20_04775 [bacterium DOLZORAL124_64_63]|nr:MAG: hypothetical protein CSB20_04775 [bacterium DOLZORAL124_64_63]